MMPELIREIGAKHLNTATVAQRAEIANLNVSLQQELTSKGMAFNSPNTEAFREKLRRGGYYAERKSKFGEKA